MLAALLLKEIKAINTNITTMHNDRNNLVVVSDDIDDIDQDVDNQGDGVAEALEERTETVLVALVDVQVGSPADVVDQGFP